MIMVMRKRDFPRQGPSVVGASPPQGGTEPAALASAVGDHDHDHEVDLEDSFSSIANPVSVVVYTYMCARADCTWSRVHLPCVLCAITVVLTRDTTTRASRHT